jgi:3-oxoacyl-[acyl-carrier-protein] synthase-3
MRVRIVGLGQGLPQQVVTNAMIAPALGVTAEWIESRTGVQERRIAADDEYASTLATVALKQALSQAGLLASALDLVVVATTTPDHRIPPTSIAVCQAVGAGNAGAFDLNAACSGFVHALITAAALTGTGPIRRTAVVGVDVLSRIIDPHDRNTAGLLGDGAAAVIVEPAPDVAELRYAFGCDGSRPEDVYIAAGGSKLPTTRAGVRPEDHYLRMSGGATYKLAVRSLVELANRLGMDDVDLVVPHQANVRILRECASVLGLRPEQYVVNISRYGNTSAASAPLALFDAWAEGRLKPGHRVMLLGFGAGFTWGGAVLEWTMDEPG